VLTKSGKAQLKWKTNFAPKWTRRYSKAQVFVDSEVLRRCEPYTPLLTGTLIKSGILGTEVGSGTVKWITPYAKRQYWQGRKPGESSTGPLRGRLWFARMKEVHGSKIIAGAKKLIGKE
jgi:hypothetical protein